MAALVSRTRADLAAAGATAARLWLLDGNLRAKRFYECDGWTTDGTRRTHTVWGVTVDEIEYGRPLGPP